jgi:DNA-binding NtrC family response regulator
LEVADDLLESFKARYSFALDPFQLDAIRAIQDGKSVIVSAPTGSGKTLVAEFAIHATLARQRRIAYTTPLKALSNQKYADFCRQFGSEHVGILTGDVKVNARASVVVMTTEILRNMFYTGGLDGLEPHRLPDAARETSVPVEVLSMAAVEKEAILRALERTGGNRLKASQILGIGLRTLQKKLKDYGMTER